MSGWVLNPKNQGERKGCSKQRELHGRGKGGACEHGTPGRGGYGRGLVRVEAENEGP